jgi:hypothetical protein
MPEGDGMHCNQINTYGPNGCGLNGGAYLDDLVALRDLAVEAARTLVSRLLAFGEDRTWRIEGLNQAAAAAHTTAATQNEGHLGPQLCLSHDRDDDRPAERELGEGAMAHDLAVRAALFVALAGSSSALLALPYLSL